MLITCDPKDRETTTYKRFSKLINAQGLWVLQTYTPTNQTFELQSIKLTASFVDLYDEVELEANPNIAILFDL